MKSVFAGLALALAPCPAQGADYLRSAGTKGPVELTLEVARDEIHVGLAPWVAVELKNVGKVDIQVIDELFSERSRDVVAAHERGSGPGIYFELKGPSGTAYRYGYPTYPHECLPWNRQKGGAPGKLTFSEAPDGGRDDSSFARTLRPGESVRTSDFVFEPIDPETCAPVPRSAYGVIKAPLQKPSGFQELGAFRFEKPGKYKLRAVYDQTPSEAVRKTGLEPDPWDVKAATKWFTILVVE